MHIQPELSRKIEWACDLHTAEMEISARQRQNASKITKRAGEFFTASALYVAIVVMWVAIALRLV
jgi:hypothetical protein